MHVSDIARLMPSGSALTVAYGQSVFWLLSANTAKTMSRRPRANAAGGGNDRSSKRPADQENPRTWHLSR